MREFHALRPLLPYGIESLRSTRSAELEVIREALFSTDSGSSVAEEEPTTTDSRNAPTASNSQEKAE